MTHTYIVLIALLLLILPAPAQETPEQVLQRLAGLGQGVHDVKSENGRLKSLKIVGQERISTVLGTTQGLLTAQTKASLRARAAFVEWITSQVTYVSQASGETVVVLQGSGGGVTEQGKSAESVKETVTVQAIGLVKGLVLVGKDVDPETGLLTLVYGWSLEKAARAGEAQAASPPVPQLPSLPDASTTIPVPGASAAIPSPTPAKPHPASSSTDNRALKRQALVSPAITD